MPRPTFIALFVVLLLCTASLPAVPDTGNMPVARLPDDGPVGLPVLSAPALARTDGRGGVVAGVYAPGVFAHPVVAQPAGNHLFVSTDPEALTQFQLASREHTIGLLAHNYLAGAHFFRLEKGDPLYLIYGNGSVAGYRVSEIFDYRAISLYLYRDLVTQRSYSDLSLFKKIYTGDGDRLVLQTCIERDGDRSWGRRFVIARRTSSGSPPEASRRGLPVATN